MKVGYWTFRRCFFDFKTMHITTHKHTHKRTINVLISIWHSDFSALGLVDPPLFQVGIDLCLVALVQLPASLAKCRVSLNLWGRVGPVKFLPPGRDSVF